MRYDSASATWAGPTCVARRRAPRPFARHGDAHAPATRQRQPVDRAREQLRGGFVRRGSAMRKRSRAATTRSRTAPEARRAGRELHRARTRHRDGQIEPIEQRARELLAVCREPLGVHPHSTAGSPRAPHGHRFIVPTSWNRAGKIARPPRARRRRRRPRAAAAGPRGRSAGTRAARRAAARRDARATTSPGRGAGPPPTIAGGRRAVVRSAERRHGDERPPGGSRPGDRMDPRHLERLVPRRAAEGSRAAAARASSSRFPGGPASSRLCGPRRRSRAPAAHAPARARRRGRARATRLRAPRRQRRRTHGGSRSRRAGTRPPRRGDAPAPARRRRARPRARTRPRRRHGRDRRGGLPPRPRACRRPADPAVERELADRGVLGEALGGSWRDAARTASAIGRSKPEPSLRSAAGREVDGDAPVQRPLERGGRRRRCGRGASPPGTARSASPTIAKPGTPRLEVRLDLDAARLEADERVGDRAREHRRR